MDRRQLAGVIVGAVGAAWSLDQGARAQETTRADIRVTAQVAGVAAIERAHVPAMLSVSPADRQSGRVHARVSLIVRTNAADGYVVTFWPRAGWFESFRVAGFGSTVDLPADGGAVVRRHTAPGVEHLDLELSFALRDGVEADELPWPVAFAVEPL
jgi:hypothetical protein